MCDRSTHESIPLLVGPTAVGKTSLSIDIATRIHGEIISADARQVYRHIDVGTAKPSREQLEQIPHYFINELDLNQPFSAGRFARSAEAKIKDVLSRDSQPIVVGGSTLYIDALVRGFSDIPDVEPDIRAELNSRLRKEGSATLYRELRSVDPTSAATMDETKSQRIVRALEIFYGAGTPLSEFHASRRPPSFKYSGVILIRPRGELYRRIDSRVDQMVADGLVDEVRSLIDGGGDPSVNALSSIGYREAVDYVGGHCSFEEMVRLIKRNSRRYAKRQLTWFSRYESFIRIHADEPVEAIVEHFGHRPCGEDLQ